MNLGETILSELRQIKARLDKMESTANQGFDLNQEVQLEAVEPQKPVRPPKPLVVECGNEHGDVAQFTQLG